MSSDVKPLILWAEDSVEDIMLLKMAFKRAGFAATLSSHGTVEEVMSVLEDVVQTKASMPDLLLTDLKLPGTSGFDLIAWVRDRDHFRDLSIAVLSGSPLESDADRARDLGANQYLTKPAAFHDYPQIVECITNWLPKRTR